MRIFQPDWRRGFLRSAEIVARLASISALLFFTSFPGRVLAFEYERELAAQHLAFIREAEIGEGRVAGAQSKIDVQSVLPEEGMEFIVAASAYSSTIAETDNDPFTTASGTRVHLGTLAANWLPLGTTVRVEGRAYTVEDRLNSRFNGERRIDIWMSSPEFAQQFGLRTLTLEIVHLP